MRLIDADAENERLLDFIAQNDSGIEFAIEHKDMTILEDIFFDYFNDQHTVYDVDKVAQRLEEKILEIKDQLMHTSDEDMAVRLRCKMHGLDEALEIVRAGIEG